ncbi:TIR domain-containing protein [Kitasatospora sp. NPDC097691]|uniref:TIR domain-containing protein n=1 Tax=Kitasatospora sp. NPDC097691 TaxID=3157231 RepID=UPI00332DE84B
MLKVFLSWSGETSRRVAELLKGWLPDVLQALDPWVSSQDISKGSRASREISDELEGANFGIICVTAGSQQSQWVNFEAGALSKQISEAHVMPFLIDLKPTDLTGPLAQFQATSSQSRDDVLKLVLDLNNALREAAVAPDRVRRTFDRYWPDLEKELGEIRSGGAADSNLEPRRPQAEMVEEVLLLMRQQERRLVDIETRLERSFNGPRKSGTRLRATVDTALRERGIEYFEADVSDAGLFVTIPANINLSGDQLRQAAGEVCNLLNLPYMEIKTKQGRVLVEYPF